MLSTGLAGGLLWQSMQSRVVPYVVEVDRLGEARAVAPAEQRISADRSPDRLASRPVHHRRALDLARSGADAPELALGL